MSDRQEFQQKFNVSRETIERLEVYQQLLLKWNKTINLIGKSTVSDTWARHISDSASVYDITEKIEGKWLDIGSGAGLPGLILAMIAKEKSPEVRQLCIEADLRKCEFMRTVIRQTDLNASVISRRIEDTPRQNANLMTARALAPLSKLLEHAHTHLDKTGICVFHKGENWQSEVRDARENWSFNLKEHLSKGNQSSVLLEIGEIEHA
jgi:16S rRNA (guanine527-N7)-methyltransferase